jgi:hypothetical protein
MSLKPRRFSQDERFRPESWIILDPESQTLNISDVFSRFALRIRANQEVTWF